MDAFEELVAEILWHDGYWVQRSVKVKLDKRAKRSLGMQYNPREEIDILAYKAKTRELLIVECKSYLDSGGVLVSAFQVKDSRFAKRFKFFHNTKLFNALKRHLVKQLSKNGTCPTNVKPRLTLIAGNTASEKNRIALYKHFSAKGWKLLDEHWLHKKLKEMERQGYENSVAMVTSKLILRGKAAA